MQFGGVFPGEKTKRRLSAMAEVPKLSEEEWPEIRKLKAQRNTGWLYVLGLIRAIYI